MFLWLLAKMCLLTAYTINFVTEGQGGEKTKHHLRRAHDVLLEKRRKRREQAIAQARAQEEFERSLIADEMADDGTFNNPWKGTKYEAAAALADFVDKIYYSTYPEEKKRDELLYQRWMESLRIMNRLSEFDPQRHPQLYFEETSGFVYLALLLDEGSSTERAYKIGHSKNPCNRKSTLKHQYGDLMLGQQVPAKNAVEAKQWVFEYLDRYRTRSDGEIFDLPEEKLLWFLSLEKIECRADVFGKA